MKSQEARLVSRSIAHSAGIAIMFASWPMIRGMVQSVRGARRVGAAVMPIFGDHCSTVRSPSTSGALRKFRG